MNQKNILITGGSGFLGQALVGKWLTMNHRITVVSRRPYETNKLLGPNVAVVENFNALAHNGHFDAVINLAGAPIFAGRWSKARKQMLRDSRIKLTEKLLDYLAALPIKPEVLISGSAIGVYGDQGDKILTESSIGQSCFSQTLCADWENAARLAENMGVRVCLIRTGLVLDHGGGFLQKLLPAFKLCLGGQLGNGRQWMSWIHRGDWVAIVDKLLNQTELHGVFNATAPHPVTNREFSGSLAKQLHRPMFPPIPASLLRLALGEMSELMLGSQRVIPERLLERNFRFQFTDLESALRNILEPH